MAAALADAPPDGGAAAAAREVSEEASGSTGGNTTKIASGGAGGAADGSLKLRSGELTGEAADPSSWLKRTGTRSYLYRIGWSDEDLKKPVITVGVPWTNASSCNHHFTVLQERLVVGARSCDRECAARVAARLTSPYCSSCLTTGCDRTKGRESVHRQRPGRHRRHRDGDGGYEIFAALA